MKKESVYKGVISILVIISIVSFTLMIKANNDKKQIIQKSISEAENIVGGSLELEAKLLEKENELKEIQLENKAITNLIEGKVKEYEDLLEENNQNKKFKTKLFESLEVNENDYDWSLITGSINGTPIIPIAKKTDIFKDVEYFRHISMFKETESSIYFDYYENDHLVVVEMDKKEFTLINKIEIQIGEPLWNYQIVVKEVDDEVFVLLNDRVEVYSLSLQLNKTINLPEFMLSDVNKTRSRAADGRESNRIYDISDDLKTIVFSDMEGVKLYHRISKTIEVIMETPSLLPEDGISGYAYYLQPRYFRNYIMTQVHGSYVGFIKFYMYDLETKLVKTMDLEGTTYGYYSALGDKFTIANSESYLEKIYGEDAYKHTLIYDVETKEFEVHPMGLWWGNVAFENVFFDGENGSAYLGRSWEQIGHNSDEPLTYSLYYYNYETRSYIDKSMTFGLYENIGILGMLKDNSSIVYFRTEEGDFFVRF